MLKKVTVLAVAAQAASLDEEATQLVDQSDIAHNVMVLADTTVTADSDIPE